MHEASNAVISLCATFAGKYGKVQCQKVTEIIIEGRAKG